MKRILCLWLPNWPIQRLSAARPELRGQAVVVSARLTQGPRVRACSPAAYAAGVRCHMPVAEATALVRRTQDSESSSAAGFYTLAHDATADREALLRLAEWCERFSPLVGMEPTGNVPQGEADEAEGLLLEVTGLGPLFGGETALVQTMVNELAAQGFVARVAVADTVGAAWAMAHFGSVHSCGWLPLLPSPDAATPRSPEAGALTSAAWVLPAGQMTESLRALPVAALRLANATIATLRQLGLEHIGDVLRLPRASLSSRVGDRVLLRIDQATGQAPELIGAHHAAPDFQAHWCLEYPTDQREVVECVLEQLLGRIAEQLAARNRGAVRLEVRLCCGTEERGGEGAEKNFRLDLFRPTAIVAHWMELVQLQLETGAWPAAVREVQVRAVLTAPLEVRQGELFEGSQRDGTRALSLLINRLSSRLGCEAVLRPKLAAEAQPERACRYVPWAGSGEKRKPRAVVSPRLLPAADRPLQLQHPPLPLQVVAAVPDGPPARFQDQRGWHDVLRVWGPERIETGWWRGGTVRRDYYRVETRTGLRFWLFRRLDDGRWFLHGYF